MSDNGMVLEGQASARDFHLIAHDYIKSCIRQRKYLIKSGKAKNNNRFINQALTELDRLITANPYNTDHKMARFWINHAEQIFTILPGRTATGHEKAVAVFYLLSQSAQAILPDAIPLPDLPSFSLN